MQIDVSRANDDEYCTEDCYLETFWEKVGPKRRRAYALKIKKYFFIFLKVLNLLVNYTIKKSIAKYISNFS